MDAGDEETLKAYIDESLEHLADIETDLLEIEKSGIHMDAERVNKVFRAAHSIKGGAGFIGLDNIKTLSHHMENVLGLMRTQKLIPNPENINFLLLASDALKDLLAHVEKSDEMDISHHIEALSSIIALPESPVQEKTVTSLETSVRLPFPDGRPGPTVSPADLERIRNMKEEGKSVYLLEIPLPQSAQKAEHPEDDLLEEARSYGTLLAHQLDRNQPPRALSMLFACVLDPEDVANLFEIGPSHVHEISEEGGVPPANEGIQEAEPESGTHTEHSTSADPGKSAAPPSPPPP